MNINQFTFDEKISSICRINQAIELAQGDEKSIEALKAVKKLIQSEINLENLEANRIEESNDKGYIRFEWDWNAEKHSKEQELNFELFILECAFQQRANLGFANPYREPILQEYSILFGNKPSTISNNFTI